MAIHATLSPHATCDLWLGKEVGLGKCRWGWTITRCCRWIGALRTSHRCRRMTTVDEILTIEIKPRRKKGTKITFLEKGNKQPNVIPSDLVFVVDEKPHATFIREGNDLIVMQKISLEEVLTGHTVHLTTLDGRSFTIPINNNNNNYKEVVP